MLNFNKYVNEILAFGLLVDSEFNNIKANGYGNWDIKGFETQYSYELANIMESYCHSNQSESNIEGYAKEFNSLINSDIDPDGSKKSAELLKQIFERSILKAYVIATYIGYKIDCLQAKDLAKVLPVTARSLVCLSSLSK